MTPDPALFESHAALMEAEAKIGNLTGKCAHCKATIEDEQWLCNDCLEELQ